MSDGGDGQALLQSLNNAVLAWDRCRTDVGCDLKNLAAELLVITKDVGTLVQSLHYENRSISPINAIASSFSQVRCLPASTLIQNYQILLLVSALLCAVHLFYTLYDD